MTPEAWRMSSIDMSSTSIVGLRPVRDSGGQLSKENQSCMSWPGRGALSVSEPYTMRSPMATTRAGTESESQFMTSMSWAAFCSSRPVVRDRSACQSLK